MISASDVLDVLPVVHPADHILGPEQGQWTYTDYAAVPNDGHRYEVIEGVLYMAPAPGSAHQSANNLLQTYLTIHVQFTGLGRVFGPPFDVELAPGTVVQPDVTVVLAPNLGVVTPRGIVGAPDLVVEIASPGTATHDRSTKLHAYSGAGIREYWIADPHAYTVELLVLEHGSYRAAGVFQGKALLPSTVVPGLPVRVEQFFA
ncbi:MAG: Uma2 family endonuclease [Herpetosiphonaceae bacterium]|nr:Uma2 family endonuclease [Herpetosiphonaceae bacterium]